MLFGSCTRGGGFATRTVSAANSLSDDFMALSPRATSKTFHRSVEGFRLSLDFSFAHRAVRHNHAPIERRWNHIQRHFEVDVSVELAACGSALDQGSSPARQLPCLGIAAGALAAIVACPCQRLRGHQRVLQLGNTLQLFVLEGVPRDFESKRATSRLFFEKAQLAQLLWKRF